MKADSEDLRHLDMPEIWLDVGGFAWSHPFNGGHSHADKRRERFVRADLSERYRDALRELLAASEAIDVDTWTKPAITQRLADAEDAARAVLAASEDGEQKGGGE